MSRTSEGYPTSAFDYHLPPERIAQHPTENRDESKLLVLDRSTGALRHRVFRDIADMIPAGDALVLNETRVFPARLLGRRAGGGEAEVLLLRAVGSDLARARGDDSPTHHGGLTHPPIFDPSPGQSHSSPGQSFDDLWEAMVRPGSKLKPGRTIEIAPDLAIDIIESRAEEGTRIVRLRSSLAIADAIARHGRIPLPPYMHRDPDASDAERYQTVYAREAGSVAAPTAGLHFTPELLARLEAGGVRLVRLLLHVGVGTFRPVEVDDPAQHRMHAEQYEVTAEAAAALNRTREQGGAIWAVGTTVTRTLESVADASGVVRAGAGWTRLFIRPPYRFRAVNRLITNFHLPRSTLLMLVAAFGGYDTVMRAYREAIQGGYRFYSYGDAMVIV